MAGVCSKMDNIDLFASDSQLFESIFNGKLLNNTRKLIDENKNPREFMTSRDSNNNSSSHKKKRSKNKWTEGYKTISLSNNNSLLDEVIDNSSLCAAVETDIKMDNRKRKLSTLKSDYSYKKVSDSLKKKEKSINLNDFKTINKSFYSRTTILQLILSSEKQSVSEKSVCSCCQKGRISCLRNICEVKLKDYILNDNDPFQVFLPAYDVIKDIRSRYLLKFKSNIEDDVRAIIRDQLALFNLDTKTKGKSRFKLKFFLETASKEKFPVCKSIFCEVYGISKSVMKRLIREAKANVTNSSKSFGKTFSVPLDVARRIKSKTKTKGKPLSSSDYAALIIPNTTGYKKAYAWMKHHFNTSGDFVPNSATDEIHLELITIKEIYKEYRYDLKYIYKLDFKDSITYNGFVSLWDKAFPHVKIRKFKAVTGKCRCCANLSMMRKQSTSSLMRELISDLHARHRQTVIKEKMMYYDRCHFAVTHPSKAMSMITDGMNKNHSKVPWYGNLCEFPCPLNMHIQCVIEHGQEIVMYRSFENVRQDSNLAIHAFLMQLERRLSRLKTDSLTYTLYLQYDGGAENANKATLALCELLVARRVFSEIIITRLPVGHTHEDCDALFGILWKLSRARHILTPDQYKDIMYEALSCCNVPVHVEDILVVPDYVKVLESCVDPEIEFFAKKDDTQLQWRFTAVEPCPDYPFGVKTQYRLYAQDTPTIIVENSDPYDLSGLEYEPLEINCEWLGSWDQKDQINQTGLKKNIHILIDLPFEEIIPSGFVDGASASFQKTLRKFNKVYRGDRYADQRDKFESFINSLPKTDNVSDYLAHSPDKFNIPLVANTRLFSSNPVDISTFVPPITVVRRNYFNGKPIKQAKAAPSVKHSGNKGLVLPMSITNLDDTPILSTSVTGQSSTILSISQIMNFNSKNCPINERKLKEILQSLGLKTNGKKEELLKKIQSFYFPTTIEEIPPKISGKVKQKKVSDELSSNWSTKTVKELKDFLKERGVKRLSNLKREELLKQITLIDSCNIPIPDDAESIRYNPSDVESIYTMDNINSDNDGSSIATGSIFDRSSKVDDMTLADETSCSDSNSSDDSDNNSDQSVDDEVSI